MQRTLAIYDQRRTVGHITMAPTLFQAVGERSSLVGSGADSLEQRDGCLMVPCSTSSLPQAVATTFAWVA